MSTENIMVCCPVDTSQLPAGPELDNMLGSIRSTPGYETAVCAHCGQLCHIGPKQIEVLEAQPMLVLCFTCTWDATENATMVTANELTSRSQTMWLKGRPE